MADAIFALFKKVFWSYKDDGWVIIKGCVQWNPFTPSAGPEPETYHTVITVYT